MTCEFRFCFWSETKSQIEAVFSFSYTELCCRQKCVNTLTLFKRNAKGANSTERHKRSAVAQW